MGNGFTPEGITGALLFFTVLVVSGAYLWQDARLRRFIAMVWLFNVADIVAQLVVSHSNGYVPEFWAINYLIAAVVLFREHSRNSYPIIQLTAVVYFCALILALVLIGARYVENGRDIALIALPMLHIIHLGIIVGIGGYAGKIFLAQWAED